MDLIRIGARKSQLSFMQAKLVQKKLKVKSQIFGIMTSGDRYKNSSLSKIGGKGLFVKELELALLNKEIDIAVHSMKDVPAFYDERLVIPCIVDREDPRDVFISNKYKSLLDLPEDSIVGTSSPRRKAQLNCIVKPIRGNIETRLSKLGEFDAIILAYAAMKRMNLLYKVTEVIAIEHMLPAVGQGAICVQCRKDDFKIIEILKSISIKKHQICVDAERSFLRAIKGDCDTPAASYAEFVDSNEINHKGIEKLHVRYLLAGLKGVHITQRYGFNFDEMARDAAEECIFFVS